MNVASLPTGRECDLHRYRLGTGRTVNSRRLDIPGKRSLARWGGAAVQSYQLDPDLGGQCSATLTDRAKRSSKPRCAWYWIHRDQDVHRFPDSFTGGTYGDFVLSAILTFRLKNAYMTNLIKCGLNVTVRRNRRASAPA
jgi:hypothetical protein